MKFTSAIIALSAVAALVQAGAVESTIQQVGAAAPGVMGTVQQVGAAAPVMDAAQKVDGLVGNAAQKRGDPLTPVKAALAPVAGAVPGLSLIGQSVSADADSSSDSDTVHVKRDALGGLGGPVSLAKALLPKLDGSGASLQKRDTEVKVDANLKAEIKAAVKACLDAVANVEVKAELVAQVLAKVKANLGVKISADLEAKLLGKSFRANCRTFGCAFLAHHCFLYSLDAFL